MRTADEPTNTVESALDSRWRTVGLLAAASFAVFCNSLVVGPLLVEIAATLGVSVATAGQLVAATALPSAGVAVAAGPLLDRFGRRPVLVVALGVATLGSLAAALAPTFGLMAAGRFLAGLGAATVWPACLAAIGDLFPYRRRAWAISILTSASLLAPVAGVPAATLIAEALGWRWSLAAVAGLILAADLALLISLPSGGRVLDVRSNGFLAGYREVVTHPAALAFLAFGFVSHVFWHGFLTYAGPFYQLTYGLSVGSLAPILSAVALVGLAGSLAGGRLAVAIGGKRLATLGLAVTAFLVFVQLTLPISLAVAIALHVAWSLPNGARGPAANALLTEVLPMRRGTVVSLNSAASSLGTFLGASVGGLSIESAGFPGLGVLCGATSLLSAIIIWRFISEPGEGHD